MIVVSNVGRIVEMISKYRIFGILRHFDVNFGLNSPSNYRVMGFLPYRSQDRES